MVDVKKNVNGNRKHRNRNSKNKNKAVRLVAILMCIVLVMTALPFAASASSYIGGWDSGDVKAVLIEYNYNDFALYIYGNGEMADYSPEELPPWFYDKYGCVGDYTSFEDTFGVDGKIQYIYIDEGVTSIGAYAFYGLGEVTYIHIADTVTSINDCAFNYCIGQTTGTLNLPGSIEYLSENALEDDLDEVYVNCPCYNTVVKDYIENQHKWLLVYTATHENQYTVNEPVSDAVCTEGGTYNQVTYCSDCGTKLSSKAVTVDATGHDFVHYDAVEPTCTGDGNIEYWKCSVCGEYFLNNDDIYSTDYADYDKDIAISATGHTKGDYVIENQSDTNLGLDYYEIVYYCTVCGEEISRTAHSGFYFGDDFLNGIEIILDWAIDFNGTFYSALDAETHDSDSYTLTFDEDTITQLGNALCQIVVESFFENIEDVQIDDAKMILSCLSQRLSEQGYIDIPFTFYTRDGDDWHNALSMTVTATYDENTEEFSCDYELLNSDFADGTTQDIAIADLWMVIDLSCPHSYELTDTKDATCTEDGYNTYTCSWCGDEYTDTITATGHTWDEDNYVIENEVEATKSTDGSYDKVWYCDVCGEEVQRETVTTSATGYTWNDNIYVDDELSSTIEDLGYDEITLNDDSLTEFAEIALESKEQGLYLEKVDFTTTDENSYLNNVVITITFSATEEDGLVSLKVNAHADNLIEGIEDYSADGDVYVNYYFYTTCPHDYQLIETVEPTKNTDGYNRYHCYICGDEYDEVLGATGFTQYIWTFVDGEPLEDYCPSTTKTSGYFRYDIDENSADGIIHDIKLFAEGFYALGYYLYDVVYWCEDDTSPLNDIVTTVTWSADASGYNIDVQCEIPEEDYSSFDVSGYDSGLFMYCSSTCPHDFQLISKKAATATEDGYYRYHCYICGEEYDEVIPATNTYTLTINYLSTGLNKNGEQFNTYTQNYEILNDLDETVTYEYAADSEYDVSDLIIYDASEFDSSYGYIYSHTQGDVSGTMDSNKTINVYFDPIYVNQYIALVDVDTGAIIAQDYAGEGVYEHNPDTTGIAVGTNKFSASVAPTLNDSSISIHDSNSLNSLFSYLTEGLNNSLLPIIFEDPEDFEGVNADVIGDQTYRFVGEGYYCSDSSQVFNDFYVNVDYDDDGDYSISTNIFDSDFSDCVVKAYKGDSAYPGFGNYTTNDDMSNSSWSLTNGYGYAYNNEINVDCLDDTELSICYIAYVQDEHVWDDGVVTTPATCTTDGEMTYACQTDGCGVTKTEVIPATGHDYQIDSDRSYDATCTEEGLNVYVCQNGCGSEYTETVEKIDHTPGEPVEENRVEATKKTDGSYDEVIYCTVCGAELSRTTITIPHIGYTYNENYYVDGVLVYASDTEYEAANNGVDFSDSEWLEDLADMAKEFLNEYGCYLIEFNFETPDTDSVLNDATITFTYTGSIDDLTVTATVNNVPEGHENDLLEDDLVLNICFSSSCPHDYKLIDSSEPNCTENGHNTYHCYICGDEYTETIDALGHTEGETVIENEVSATCTVQGSYDEVVYCSVCGEEISRTTIKTDALGHTEGETVIENVVEPTCTSDGSHDEVVYCEVCGAELSRVTVTDEATGHHYIDTVVDPTDDEMGYTEHKCEDCDDYYRDNYTDALGHDYELVETAEPTCTEDGYNKYQCKTCDASYTETLPATGHTADNPVIENEITATCTTDGTYDEVIYCAVCGAELSRTQCIIKANGHTAVTDEAVAATCTETGLTEGSHCSVCGEVLVEQEITQALGHDYKLDANRSYSATCTKDGANVYVCQNGCGSEYTETISATGHTYTSTVTKEATCTEEGIITYTCVNGDDTYIEYIPMIAHTEGTAVKENIVEATKDADGSYDLVVYCTVCGTELSRETITVPYENTHEGETPTLNEGTFTPATEDEDGSYEVTYPDGTTEERTIPAGDTDEPIVHDDTFVAPTDDEDGSVTVTMPDGEDVIVVIPSGTEPEYKQDDDGNWYEEYPTDVGDVDIEIPVLTPDTYVPATDDTDGEYNVEYSDGTDEDRTIDAGDTDDPVVHTDTFTEPTENEDGSVIVTMPDGKDVVVEIPAGTEPEYKQDDDGNWYEEYPSDIGSIDIPADEPNNDENNDTDNNHEGETPTLNEGTFTPATEDEDGSYEVTYPDGTTEERTIPAGDTDDPVVHDDTFVAPTDDEDGSVTVTMPDGEDVIVVIPSGTEPEYKQDDDGNWYEEYPTDVGDVDIEIPTYTPDTYVPADEDNDGGYTVVYPDGTVEDRTIDEGNTDDPVIHDDTVVEPMDDTDGSVIVTMPDDKDVIVEIPSGTIPDYVPDTYTPATEDTDGSYTVTYPTDVGDVTVEHTIPAGTEGEPTADPDTLIPPTEDEDGSVIVTMPDGEDVKVTIPSGSEPEYKQDDDGNWVEVYPSDIGDLEIEIPILTPDTYTPSTDDSEGSYNVTYGDGTSEDRIIEAGNDKEIEVHTDTFVAPTDDTDGSVIVTMPDNKDVMVVIPAGTEGTYKVDEDGNTVIVYPTEIGDIEIPVDLPTYTPDTFVPATETEDGSYTVVLPDGTVEERTIPAGNTDDPIIHDDSFIEPTEDTNGSVVVTMPDGEDVIVEIPAGTIPDYVEGTYVPATETEDGSYDVIYHTDVGDIRITITIPAGTEGEPTFDLDSFVAPTDTEDGYVYVTMPDGKVVKYVIAAGTEGTLTQLDDGSWVTVYSTDFGDLEVPSDYTGDTNSDNVSEETADSAEIVETNDSDVASGDEDNADSVQVLDTGTNNHIVIIIIIVIILLACIIILAVVNKKSKTKKK